MIVHSDYKRSRRRLSYSGMEFHIFKKIFPLSRWTKKGGALPQGRTTYDNYGKTLVIKHVDFDDEGELVSIKTKYFLLLYQIFL